MEGPGLALLYMRMRAQQSWLVVVELEVGTGIRRRPREDFVNVVTIGGRTWYFYNH